MRHTIPCIAKIIMHHAGYSSVKVAVLLAIVAFSGMPALQAHAHTTVEAGPFEIEVGWGIEPPVVGIRNDFVFRIIEPGQTEGAFTGVTNAFHSLEATAVFGGATKKIDVNSDARPGYYYSSVIPTKTGSYSVQLDGEINGIAIDVQVPIEDVEGTAILDFPQTGGSSSDQDVAALKNAISSIQQDVSKIQSGTGVRTADGGAAYNFAILGLSMASAAIILAVISLVKRK